MFYRNFSDYFYFSKPDVMKKIMLMAFIALMLCSRQNVNAQITVDHVYTTDPPSQAFKLSSGLKYFAEHYSSTNNSVTYFVLYNPDHSIFRTINVPQIPGKYDFNISFVSDALFDTDPLIECMLYYSDAVNPPVYDVAILNENGNPLLYEDSAQFDVTSSGGDLYRGFVLHPIFLDGNQIKLYLYKGLPLAFAKTIVYNLPGQLTCLECNNGFVNGIVQPLHLISEENKSLAYPNPSTDYIKIKYSLPPNFKHAFINLYDITGKLIKQKEIDGQYDDIYLSTEDIRQGAYSYAIVVDGKKLTSGKIIKL